MTTVVFVPLFPRGVHVLFGDDNLHLFILSGAYACTSLPDSVIDEIQLLDTDREVEEIYTHLQAFCEFSKEQLCLSRVYSYLPEEPDLFNDFPYSNGLGLMFNHRQTDEDFHLIIPILKHVVTRMMP